jgi:hypothetical protein
MKVWMTLTAFLFIATSAVADMDKDITTLDHAKFNTEVAENMVKTTKSALGGHREKAIEAIAAAVKEIDDAILYAKQHPGQ